ncbi:MAG TPA: hypothetical protein G4N94_06115 [Caldilineae bacterium]|nr:hypothetical protein [Caldilineae bacterium]
MISVSLLDRMNASRPIIASLFLAALLSALLTLAGCVAPNETPTAAADLLPGSADVITGVATVEEIEINLLESFPVQVQVLVRGVLPDSCTTIGETNIERTDNTFHVTVTTVRPAVAECEDVELAFEQTIALDAKGLPAGTYDVDVNSLKSSFELSVDNAALPEPSTPAPTADQEDATSEPQPEISGAASAARNVMAKTLKVKAEDIEIVSEEQVDWPDACLGLAKPEESCLQQITPGYKVTLRHENTTHVYRTDESGEVVREESVETVEPTTPTETESPATEKTCTDRIAFVRDITVPDGTKAPPNKEFTKTWRLRNAGTCTWDTSYDVVFVEGDQMGGPDETPLLIEVPPGKTLDVSVRLTSPSKKGTYKGFWGIRNGQGEVFGLGKQGKNPFWLQIRVTKNAPAAKKPTGGSISGFTWHDLCASDSTGDARCVSSAGGAVANGVYDEGEPRIGGLEVKLGKGTCPATGLAAVIADAQGNYSFEKLATGVYCVSIDAESDYNKHILLPGAWTYPPGSNGQSTVKVVAGQTSQAISDVNFGWDYEFAP